MTVSPVSVSNTVNPSAAYPQNKPLIVMLASFKGGEVLSDF